MNNNDQKCISRPCFCFVVVMLNIIEDRKGAEVNGQIGSFFSKAFRFFALGTAEQKHTLHMVTVHCVTPTSSGRLRLYIEYS